MQRYAAWLWRRYPTNYVWAVSLTVAVVLLAIFSFPTVVALGLIFDANGRDLVVVGGVASTLMVTGIAFGAALHRDLNEPLRRWAGGDRAEPELVWQTALRAPQALATRAVVLQAPFQLLVLVPLAASLFSDEWTTVLSLGGGMGLLLVTGGLMAGVGMQALFRPVLDEVAPLVPPHAVPATQGWSLRARIAVSLVMTSVAAAVVGGIAAREFDSPEAGYAGAMAAGIGFGAYSVYLVVSTVAAPSFAPLQNLIGATQRVRRGDFTEGVPVTTADEFGELSVAFNDMQTGLRERESLQAAFGSYVDPSLARRLLAQGDSVFEGEEVDVTVFFADVRGFTTYAELVTAEEAVARLNRLFDLMVPAIRDAGGHANHYLGDGLLAVFGTPDPLDDHADRALAAAREVQRRVKAEFGRGLKLGIGINSGPVIAGTIGGGGKLEFTVIGDTVNVAARVEALTKETGDGILLTQATVDALTGSRARLRDRGEFEVRGKQARVRLYSSGKAVAGDQ